MIQISIHYVPRETYEKIGVPEDQRIPLEKHYREGNGNHVLSAEGGLSS